MRKFITFILTSIMLISPLAEAGIGSVLIKIGSKVVRKGATHTDDFVTKAAREALEASPELARVTKAIGGDSVELVAKVLSDAKAVKLIEQYGDDAAVAILKNGKSAITVMDEIPGKEMAAALKTVTREQSQQLAILTTRGAVTPKNAKLVAHCIQQNGGKVVTWMAKHPILSACAFATAGTLFGPSLLSLARGLISGALWATEHPFITLCLIIITITLILGLILRLPIFTYIKKGWLLFYTKAWLPFRAWLQKRLQPKQ